MHDPPQSTAATVSTVTSAGDPVWFHVRGALAGEGDAYEADIDNGFFVSRLGSCVLAARARAVAVRALGADYCHQLRQMWHLHTARRHRLAAVVVQIQLLLGAVEEELIRSIQFLQLTHTNPT